MNRKPTFAENLQRFIEGKGFYVVVLICVLAIGVSGFYLLQSMNTGAGADTPVNASAQVVVTPTPKPSASAPASPSPTPSEPVLPKVTPPAVTSPSPSPSPSPSASPAPSTPPPAPSRPAALVYTWPVKGELLADFSLETLAYDVTMGDWRTHSGIDIAAAPGTTVLAAADGAVSQIFEDDLMGTTVVIDHGEGITSTYANLQSVPTVEVGDQVYTGSVIGAVGATAIAESGRASHLHFEMSKNGLAVDPELYLPEER